MLFKRRRSRWDILEAKIDLLLSQRPTGPKVVERVITVKEETPTPNDGSVRYDPDTGEPVYWESTWQTN